MVQGRVLGAEDRVITGARPLSHAGPEDISFIEDPRRLKDLATCSAQVLLVPRGLEIPGRTVIEVADPMLAFVRIYQEMYGSLQPPAPGIDSRAAIHPSARIGRDVRIEAFVYIGEGAVIGDRCRLHAGVYIGRQCQLGDDVILYPHVVVYEGCRIGHRVVIHAHSVIGADGFGYRLVQGQHVKVAQLGTVEIGDDVEIGACTTIDRGTFEPTTIGQGTKIDNLVQIGHNCRIGRHNLLVSQVGIAGSSSTGDYVVIAGQAGVVDHVHIGDRAVVGAQAGVTKDVPAGACVLGSPARPEREVKAMVMSLEKLPQIRRDMRLIRARLGLDQRDAA